MRRSVRHLILWIIAVLLVAPSYALPQNVFNHCGMTGDAKPSSVKNLNKLKNRFDPPTDDDIDADVTLDAMLETGDDTDRFDPSTGAEITGYVNDVKVGGIETCNCHARTAGFRDTHIELVPGPDDSGPTRRVIVEVTPRIRAQLKQAGVDWTTSALSQKIAGKWVKVRGWLLFDQEHTAEAEN